MPVFEGRVSRAWSQALLICAKDRRPQAEREIEEVPTEYEEELLYVVEH